MEALHRHELGMNFRSSFFCADPGNLLRTDNGRLGYLDFGMMASIEPKIRRQFPAYISSALSDANAFLETS